MPADHLAGNRDHVFDVFLRQDRHAGGHAADQRQVRDLIAVGEDALVQHFQHAHPVAVSLDISLALQRHQMLVNRGR